MFCLHEFSIPVKVLFKAVFSICLIVLNIHKQSLTVATLISGLSLDYSFQRQKTETLPGLCLHNKRIVSL